MLTPHAPLKYSTSTLFFSSTVLITMASIFRADRLRGFPVSGTAATPSHAAPVKTGVTEYKLDKSEEYAKDDAFQ